jgi:cell division protein FtsL
MPEQIFILIIGIAIIYLIYKAAYVVPNDIKRIESKVNNLQLHLKEIEFKLGQLDKKIDKK